MGFQLAGSLPHLSRDAPTSTCGLKTGASRHGPRSASPPYTHAEPRSLPGPRSPDLQEGGSALSGHPLSSQGHFPQSVILHRCLIFNAANTTVVTFSASHSYLTHLHLPQNNFPRFRERHRDLASCPSTTDLAPILTSSHYSRPVKSVTSSALAQVHVLSPVRRSQI